MANWQQRRVVLTGAGSGIGQQVAKRLASEGAVVVGIDRNAEGLAQTADLLPSDAQWSAITADLSQEDEVVRAAQTAVSQLGQVDALLNVAGMLRSSPISALDTATVRGLLDVNFLAPVVMCREIVPHMPDGTSAIVNVTSTSATRAHPWLSGYAASKGALLAFTLSLSAELAQRRIRVVAVSPGGVQTPMTQTSPIADVPDADLGWYLRIMPLWGQLGDPADVAATIVFAASDDARYVNGVELRVDGGSHT